MQLHKDSRHVSEQSFDHPSNSSSSMQDRQTFLSSLPPLLCKQQQPEVILDWQLSISQACSSLVSQYNVPIVYLRTYHAKRPPLHQVLKFIYSEKATKFCEILTLLLATVHTVKSKVKISQNFEAFSEYMNFNTVMSFENKTSLI